jgi:predicted O-methyltransferase YrrM
MTYDLNLINKIKDELFALPHSSYWQIPLQGAKYLQTQISNLNPQLILEIGTSSGFSAICMAESLIKSNNLNAKIVTIESNSTRFEFAKQNFTKAELNNLIECVKGHAPKIIEHINLEPKIDFAFFDGTKSQTTKLFNAVIPLLSDNGVILVDNILSHSQKMQPFLNFLDIENYNYKIINAGAGLCEIYKN